jgi:hypothetical protein
LKKTFEPGPGSYELQGTMGHLPKHVLIASANDQINNKSNSKSQVMM